MSDEALLRRAEALTEAVGVLSLAVDGLTASQARTKRVMHLTVVGLIVGLVLLAVVGFLVAAQAASNRRLSANAASISEIQVRTSDRVLCPLYALLLEFEERSINSPALSEEERQQRRDAYVVIHQGYDTLRCH